MTIIPSTLVSPPFDAVPPNIDSVYSSKARTLPSLLARIPISMFLMTIAASSGLTNKASRPLSDRMASCRDLYKV
jgi:hypothetical protein